MSENYFYSSLSAQEIEDTLTGAVRFNADQGLTTSQKAQARQNIGAGEVDTGLVIKGFFDTAAEMEAQYPIGSDGDAYGIGEQAPYEIYIWDAVHNQWVNNGVLSPGDSVIDDEDVALDTTWSSQKISTELSGKATPADVAAIIDDTDTAEDATWSSQKIDAEITAAKWRLVWENPNPSNGSGFAAQTVPLNLSNDTEVMIQYWRPNVNQYEVDSIASVWGRVGQKIFMQLAYYQLTWRSANVTATGITFSTGYLTTTLNQTPTTAATYAVPVRIYAR